MWLLYLMPKSQNNNSNIRRHTKKQAYMIQSKEQNKTPENDPKEMQIYEMPDKELKTTVIKVLNESDKNTDN